MIFKKSKKFKPIPVCEHGKYLGFCNNLNCSTITIQGSSSTSPKSKNNLKRKLYDT